MGGSPLATWPALRSMFRRVARSAAAGNVRMAMAGAPHTATGWVSTFWSAVEQCATQLAASASTWRWQDATPACISGGAKTAARCAGVHAWAAISTCANSTTPSNRRAMQRLMRRGRMTVTAPNLTRGKALSSTATMPRTTRRRGSVEKHCGRLSRRAGDSFGIQIKRDAKTHAPQAPIPGDGALRSLAAGQWTWADLEHNGI